MKKLLTIALALTLTASLISACSNKLCPAYGSYPSKRGR
jgi:hypothetical protein